MRKKADFKAQNGLDHYRIIIKIKVSMISRQYMWLRNQFEISHRSVSNIVLPMEGIRGFAVLLVFLVHYSTLSVPWIPTHSPIVLFASGLHSIGNAGVDLFFVLSGYLIYGSLISRQQTFLQFIRRRVERIYPAFIAVFLLYLALSLLFPAESKIPKDRTLLYLVENFLLLPGIFEIESMISVAWSLSYEMFYYLSMPIVVRALQLRTCRIEWRIFGVLLIAIFTAYCCSVFNGHLRMIMFVAGIFLYESVSSRKIQPPFSAIGMLALFLGLFVMATSFSATIKIGILFSCFYVFALCCFLRPNEWLGKIFSWTPLRWLGNMSYSYYLIHGLALKAFFFILEKIFPSNNYANETLFLMFLIPAFFITLIPSIMLYLGVERPLSLPATQPSARPVLHGAENPRALF
jgi:exopolysaccharide production protein ExoZ